MLLRSLSSSHEFLALVALVSKLVPREVVAVATDGTCRDFRLMLRTKARAASVRVLFVNGEAFGRPSLALSFPSLNLDQVKALNATHHCSPFGVNLYG